MNSPSHDVIRLIIGKDSNNILCRYNLREAYYFLNTLASLNKHWNRQMNYYLKSTWDFHHHSATPHYLTYWDKWDWNIYLTSGCYMKLNVTWNETGSIKFSSSKS